MDTTLPDSIFAAARFYPSTSECPECKCQIVIEESRIAPHDVTTLHYQARCPGSRSAVPLGQAEGRLVSAILEKLATDRGLRWTISYEGLDGEPKAFRLVCDGRTMFHLPQVIGETEFEARACISMAGRLAGHG